MSIDPHDIELTDEQKRKLADLVARTGRPWQAILDQALNQYGEGRTPQQESVQPDEATAASMSLYDSLERRGLIGCVKGGPPDLSTNSKHMEGFGES